MTVENNSDKSLGTAVDLKGLNAKEIWSNLYNKELNCKKNVLEYIAMTKVLKNGNASDQQIQEVYNFIYRSIDEMASTIKPNTMMFLKNELKAQLGRLVHQKDLKPKNRFIEFFVEAYPDGDRKKDFTWVLQDVNKIADEQIWTTLAYINSWGLRDDNRLSLNQKKDILPMIELLVKRNNLKYINSLKSLSQFLRIMQVKIVAEEKGFKVISLIKK